MNNQTNDLFDDVTIWRVSPMVAFKSWLGNQPKFRSARSKEVYGYQFGKFLTWLSKRNLELHRLEKMNCLLFLDFIDEENSRKKKHRYRYLRLLERTFHHLVAIKLVSSNPFQQLLQEKTIDGNNDKTRFFLPAERVKIIAQVEQYLAVPSSTEQSLEVPDWPEIRDRALVGVIMGGGIKVGECRSLTVSCIKDNGQWLDVPGTGPQAGHQTKLLPFAASALNHWLQVRGRLALPGDVLFPAVKIGRSSRDGAPMHPTTIFRRVQAVLAAAGIDAQVKTVGKDGEQAEKSNRACAQTLRNTYAAILFDDNAPDELVKQNLGLEKEISVARLRASYEEWKKTTPGAAGPARDPRA